MAFRRAAPKRLLLATTLASGDEAIAYLAGEGKYAERTVYPFPDIVVLDLKMPGRNGFDVLEFMKKRKIQVLTIVNSDSGEKRDVERALRLGANDYHRKPEDLLVMIEWVRHLEESWARWHVGHGWRRNWFQESRRDDVTEKVYAVNRGAPSSRRPEN